MKPEKLVEACSNTMEMRAAVEGFVAKLTPLGVVGIAHDSALEMLTPEQLKGFAWQLREMAEGIEKWNVEEDAETRVRREIDEGKRGIA